MPSPQSKRSPAFQFYPKDFLSSPKVALMSMTERGVYITLLSRCWLDHGLSTDLKVLAKFVGMKAAQFDRMWTSGTLHECFHEKNGQFQNERLDRERKIQAEYRKRQKENADKRWQSHGNATALPERHASGNAPLSSSPIPYPQSSEKDVRRSAPIVARRRLDAAWEGPKGLYVPQRKHNDFVALRNHDGAAHELFEWYATVAESWTGSPGADMMKFWTARYEEQWPPAGGKADARVPAWAR